MKLNLLLVLLLFCALQPLFAQTASETPPFSGKITGNISDAETKKPLEFAAVSIYNYADSLITGCISDLDGDFELKKIPAGKFYAKIAFVGYITRRVDSLNLSAEMPLKNMGKITLAVDAKEQATVEIKAEKSLLQLGLDKKTFNVEKSALADAENATEVLRGTPGLEVDKDEAVKVRGKVVTVFINGKPTGLSGENQAAILRQIPANTIKSIEIMTNPSAKNAPDGGSGSIINIVMKKNVLTGFTGSVNAGLGTNALAFAENPEGPWFNKYSGGLSLNYKSRKINIFTNINANENNSFNNSESYRYNILPDSAYYFNTYADSKSKYQSLWGRLGTDIYINETNTLSLQMNGNPSRNNSTGALDYNNFDSDSIMRSIDQRNSDLRGLTNNMTYNAIYSIIFPEKDSTGAPNLDKLGMMGENRELVFDLQFMNNRSNEGNYFSNNHFTELRQPISTIPDSQTTRNLSGSNALHFKADYTHPIAKKEQKLQLGYHFTYEKDKNDFLYENYDAASLSMLNDSTRSNIFEYTQQIHAVYGTFSHKWSKKWSAEYGLRLEQAFVRPYLYNTATAYPWDYFGAFPTINVSYEMTETQQMTFEFGRHVSRPWMWDVNPFPNFSDPRVLSYGNPYLRPSYGNNFGVNYAVYLGQQSITLGIYGNYTNNQSDWITNINNETGVLVSSPKNLSSNYGGGFDLNGNFNVTKWWSINASANGYYDYYNANKVDSSLTYNSLGGYASVYSNMRFKFGLAISMGFNTWYTARDIQGRSIPNVWHWLSFTQTLLKKKLRLSLSINNPFYNNIWQNYTTTSFAKGFSVSRWENRVLNLRMSYNFGKTSVKKQRTSRLEGRAGGDSGGGQGGGKGK